MTDFVLEQVNNLNKNLLTRFQNQPLHGVVHEQDNFLSLASRDIDLASPTCLPDLERIQKYLEIYSTQPSPTENPFTLLFITKCTVAVYGFLLRDILNSTLPLSDALQYWNGIYGSKRYESYYALQTLPIRMTYLGINTVKKMRTTQLGLRCLWSSPEQLFIHMFPMHVRDWIRSSQQRTFRFFTANHRSSIFKQLIHEEIRQKIHALEYFRSQQASRLGLMMKLTPFMFGEEKDISTQSNECVTMMKYLLQPLKNISSVYDFNLNETLDHIELATATQTVDIANDLLQIIRDWPICQANIASLKSVHGPPSRLARYWIPSIFGFFAVNIIIKLVSERQDDIIVWLAGLGITARDFAVHWIWEPVLHVWNTVRLKDERLSVLGKEGLKSDLESLERMVSEFAHDHYHLSKIQVASIIQNVREGDMSLILRAYENEIKHPLKSAVQGDLLQTLLIQVQKTKVDMDLAMAALDKLLKSNELNFAFLAVAPSMLLAWGGLAWLKRMWHRRNGRNIDLVRLPMRHTMRRIERLFNLASESNVLDCESQGKLLCEVHLLRSFVTHLPTKHSVRDLFLEDLRDLENPRLTIKQKLETIERMTRSWSFLR